MSICTRERTNALQFDVIYSWVGDQCRFPLAVGGMGGGQFGPFTKKV